MSKKIIIIRVRFYCLSNFAKSHCNNSQYLNCFIYFFCVARIRTWLRRRRRRSSKKNIRERKTNQKLIEIVCSAALGQLNTSASLSTYLKFVAMPKRNRSCRWNMRALSLTGTAEDSRMSTRILDRKLHLFSYATCPLFASCVYFQSIFRLFSFWPRRRYTLALAHTVQCRPAVDFFLLFYLFVFVSSTAR